MRKENDEAKDIETFFRLEKEASYLQNRLGEISCWGARICGQILATCTTEEKRKIPKELMNPHQIKQNKTFANLSFEHFEDIIQNRN